MMGNSRFKFRAWDKLTKRMYLEPLVYDGEALAEYSMVRLNKALANGGDADENEPKDHKLVWMQYTGLKDSNGVEIFEGDKVKIDGYYAKIGIVEYNEPSFAIYDGKDGVTHFDWEEWEQFEVIGNIYEGVKDES